MLPQTESSAAAVSHAGPSSYSISALIKHLGHLLLSVQWQRLLRPKVLFGWEDVVSRSTDTSWLDGLRGVAAVQVFLFHFSGRYIQYGHLFGSSPDDYYIHQLPVFHPIFFGGPGAVSVFFVISGYAITVKSFMLIRQGRLDDMYRGLTSSLFRRMIRLYGPVVLVALPVLVLMQTTKLPDSGYMYWSEVQSSWPRQVLHFVQSLDGHMNPFVHKDDGGPVSHFAYIPQSWTLPMEYYGSITCYLMILLVARVETFRMRAIMLGGVTVYAVHRGCWWASNFTFGMLLADWMLERKSSAVSISGSLPSTSSVRKNVAWFAVFFVGWYLEGMCPKVLAYDFSPVPRVGYETLYKLYPPLWLVQVPEDNRWYWYLSGNLIVLGISQHAWLKSIFETRFCQWLGKLSYSLYLCHLLILSMMGKPLEAIIKQYTESPPVVYVFVWSIDVVLILIVSTFIERYVDRPSVQFAKFVEKKFCQPDQSVEQPEKVQVLPHVD